MSEAQNLVSSVEPLVDYSNGSQWIRADFHLHTKADKEFKYTLAPEEFVNRYVDRLAEEEIALGVITNHNKFDVEEFKALRRKAKRRGICLLPGVELSVADGAKGVHTLIVFSDEWLENGKDYINQFLGVVFKGKAPQDYENENGRTTTDLMTTLAELEEYHRDYFIVFAHVEASNGLWKELEGGRLEDLSKTPEIQKRCLGFQKVRTHDKADAKCRVKVQKWWGDVYPAEVEGSDPKSLTEIGKGKEKTFVKLGAASFSALKYALADYQFRVSRKKERVSHSHITAVRFEGGILDGQRVPISQSLNCFVGIRGSGKSSILECIRYALNLERGGAAQDKEYKEKLIPHALKSGGKVIVEITDRHGSKFEVSRILNESPDVFIDGKIRPGISIVDTLLKRPLYFGQKDLAAAGAGFGADLVEKLVGTELAQPRKKVDDAKNVLNEAVGALSSSESDADALAIAQGELENLKFQLEKFEEHGVPKAMAKQVSFDADVKFASEALTLVQGVLDRTKLSISESRGDLSSKQVPESKHNSEEFEVLKKHLITVDGILKSAEESCEQIERVKEEIATLLGGLKQRREDLKDEFAQTERELQKSFEEKGLDTIEPDDYADLTSRKEETLGQINQLEGSAAQRKSKLESVFHALSIFNEAALEEFRSAKDTLDAINSSQDNLKVDVEFKGNKADFYKKLDELCKGKGVRKEYLQEMCERYADFGDIFKNLEEASKLLKSKSELFTEIFHERLEELLTYRVPDSYSVKYHGKDLRSHSLGQRASAMMMFLLSQSDCEVLLIDQPEDDLDSQTIYAEVIKTLRNNKPSQQFIFATHNANFPVLGDAEMVVSCEFGQDCIEIKTGSIDDEVCQEKIVEVMEGGAEAFNRRKVVYESWLG